MSCENNTNKYIAIVEDLIKLNPSVYNNFDNVAKFIIKSPLTPEQKKLSIHNIAHIYSNLFNIDDTFYNSGKSSDVISAVHLLDNDSLYMSFVSDLFFQQPKKFDFSQKELEDKIEALKDRDFFDLEDVSELMNFISNFFSLNEFSSSEDRNEYAEQIKAEIKSVVNDMKKVSGQPAYKNFIFNAIDNAFGGLETGSKFIEIDDNVERYTGLDNYLVLLTNGNLIEAVIDYTAGDTTTLKKRNPDGTLEAIASETILWQKPSRLVNVAYGNTGEHVFRTDELTSGLTFRAADPSQQAVLEKSLSQISAVRASVRFHAIQMSGVGDERVARMKDLADREDQYEGLANRNHETFENQAQVQKLKSSPDAKVITVSRPKASERSFAIMGEIIGTGQLFYVYSNDNLVFLDANNNTKRVDFSDPNDLKEVQGLALKQGKTGLESLSESDLRELSNSNLLFETFKDKINDKFLDASAKGFEMVDITNEFFENYDLAVVRDSRKKTTLLDQLEEDKTLGKKLKIVTLDNDNVITKEEEIFLPFYITKTIYNNKPVYSINEMLAPNQRIAYLNDEGDIIHLTQSAYARDVLDYENLCKEIFKAEDAIISKAVEAQLKSDPNKKINFNKIQKTNNFVLKFTDTKIGFAIVEPRRPFEIGSNFVSYIAKLFDAIKQPGKSAAIKSFEMGMFNFIPPSIQGQTGYQLSINLSTSQPLGFKQGGKGVGNLQIEIRPYSKLKGTDNVYAKEFESVQSSFFNFPLNESVIESLYNDLTKSREFKAVVANNPSLATIDVSTFEGIQEFYNAVYSLSESQRDENINKLIKYVEVNLMNGFSNEIMKNVVDVLKKGQKLTEGFHEQLKKDLTFNGVYRPEYLFFDVSGDTKIPRIQIGRQNKATKANFNSSLQNLNVLTASPKRVSITPKGSLATNVQDKEKVDNYKIKEKPEEAPKKPESSGSTKVNTLSEEEVDELRSLDRLQNRRATLILEIQSLEQATKDLADNRLELIERIEELYNTPSEVRNEGVLQSYITRVEEIEKELDSMFNDLKRKDEELENISSSLDNLKDTQEKRKEESDETDEDIDDIDDIEKFKLVNANGELVLATPTEIESEVAFVSRVLPQWGVSISDLQDVIDLSKIDGRVLGMFLNRVIHLNNQLLVKGVVFHEAFHGVFRYLLTSEQRKSLIQAVVSDPKNASQFEQDNLTEFARARNLEYNRDKIIELIAEEILADGFQRYMAAYEKRKKEKAPSNIFERLFDLIRKLINAFKANKNEIEATYDKIASGYFKSAVINSNMFDGQVAFEIIPGPNKYINYLDEVVKDKYNLDTVDQEQLIDMVVGEMLKDSSVKSFSQKFEETTTRLLDTVYNIDLIVSQNETTKANSLRILEKFGNKFTAYRFILGGRVKGYEVNDVNLSGNSKYDGKVKKNLLKIDGKEIDNTDGNYSYETLKKLVKKKYETVLMNDLISSGEVESAVDKEEIEKIIQEDGEKGTKSTSDITATAREELDGSGDFDVTVGNWNVAELDSASSQIRRFLATMRRDIYDKETGATIPRMLDGQYMFTGLVKVTSGLPSDKIIESIRTISNLMMLDGFVDTALDLKAIYDNISNLTKITEDGVVNKTMYNMLVEVLHNVELNYSMFNVTTPKSEDIESDDIRTQQKFNFRLVDKVLEADIYRKRDQIVTNMVVQHGEFAQTKQFKDAVENLNNVIKDIITNSSDLLASARGQNYRLNDLTTKLHDNMSEIGLTIPKSLIKLSLIGIHAYEANKSIEKLDDSAKELYDTNIDFIREGQYLELDFFRSLSTVLGSMYKGENLNPEFANLMDDEGTKSDAIRRFMTILKNASAYAVKFDPTMIPSVIKNAEGKSIYRFSKYNPMALLAQRLRRYDLDEVFKDDAYYNMLLQLDPTDVESMQQVGLRQFFLDNPALGPVLRDEDSEQAKKIRLFLKNFDTSLFGGVLQILGKNEYLEGKSFKDIDSKSLYILNILSFLSRKTLIDKDGVEIQAYSRSFHQLEATQTNFLISSIHTPFVSLDAVKPAKKGVTLEEREGKILYKDKYLKIVETLEATVRQEFNRIQREWSTRHIKKENYEKNLSNHLFREYNARLNEDGLTVDVESANLRAYNFNKLSDFFDNNPELKDMYIAFAKGELLVENSETGEMVQVTDFDQISHEGVGLLDALNDFAKAEYEAHLNKLISLGVVEKVVQDKGVGQPTVFYASKMLPDFMRDTGIKTVSTKGSKLRTKDLADVYPNSAGSSSNVESIVFDHFMNFWYNALTFNELMDGDIAMNVKNFQDYVKRLKKVVASGSNMKEGSHKVAYLHGIQGFIPTGINRIYGPFYGRSEIVNARHIPEDIKQEILKQYDSEKDSNLHAIYDGQSASTIMHTMDMFESIGRLDERAKDILIAKHYRELTESEVKYLKSMKIVNNAKKTVTAGLNIYHKLSESPIDRLDVSYVALPKNISDKSRQDIYDKIHSLYTQIYNTRTQLKELRKIGASQTEIELLENNISNLASTVQAYFLPLPHRKKLHTLLNSMEYFNIDQVMDIEASKNATLLPINIVGNETLKPNTTNDGYFNLNLSSVSVPNIAKYVQVETSGVKDLAKVSVQKKLLISADINPADVVEIMEAEAKKDGRPLTDSERNAIGDLSDAFYRYRNSLNDAMAGRLDYFKTIMRDGGDIKLGLLFKLIRENLEAQGAPLSLLNYFKTDPVTNEPVFSPNLPIVRSTLEYYFMSQYSKNVTDEKASGFKNFHESSFGYDVLYDTVEQRIVRIDEIKENPAAYSDNSRYYSRPLGVDVEESEDGIKTYWVETILPSPYFNDPEHKTFYLEKLNKMFGVRIPTEDKRSMIAIKVVDFMDASKMNNVIVPHFIHLLSGSDFDIDSLFGQMMTYYKDAIGSYRLYGDYSDVNDSQIDTMEYVEFLHFMQNNSEFAPLIKAKIKELRDREGALTLEEGDVTLSILQAFNYNMDDINSVISRIEDKSRYTELKERDSQLFELKEDLKEEYLEYVKRTEENPEDKVAWNARGQLGALIAKHQEERFKELKPEIERIQELLKDDDLRMLQRNLFNTIYTYKAITQVMGEFGLPTTVQDFQANPVYKSMVTYRHQNDNLKASLDIMSNEATFNRLFINQESSTKAFEKILKTFGIDLSKITQKGNLYTIDNAISSKAENQMNKDGIGITAMMNKFLSIASQFKLELNQESIIWKYVDESGKRVIKNKFAHINDEGVRAIENVGNILGMFADGAKKPIPSALQWNEINVSTALAMLGVGLDPHMVAGFGFLPGVRNAAAYVKNSKAALNEGVAVDFVNFSSALYHAIPVDGYSELGELDLLTDRGAIISGKIQMIFKPKVLDIEKLSNNELTPTEIGFEMKTLDGKNLSDMAMTTVLLSLYRKQAQQTSKISNAASLTSMFKRLKASVTEIDNLSQAIFNLVAADDKMFTEASIQRLFGSDSVFKTMADTIGDMQDQASKIFLERNPFFRPLVSLFLNSFKDKRHIAETITSFVGIRKFLESYPGSRTSQNEKIQDLINQEDSILLQTFTPEYWFTNNLESELKRMQKLYPNNRFLKYLRKENGANSAKVKSGDKVYIMKEKIIKIIDKAKIKGTLSNTMVDDIQNLFNSSDIDTRMFVKKLFYHELARTGMHSAKGSFMHFMPPEFLSPISKGIDEFISKITEVVNDIKGLDEKDNALAKGKLLEGLKDFFEKPSMSNTEIYDFFQELLLQLAYSASQQVIAGKGYAAQAGKMSWNYDAKDDRKSGAFMKIASDLFDVTDKQGRADAIKLAKSAISYVFNLKSDHKFSPTNFVLTKNIAGDEFVINLDMSSADTEYRMIHEIARRMGIFFDEKAEAFKFPPLIQVGNSFYVYQGNEDTTKDYNMGETLVNSLSEGANRLTLFGLKARYKIVPSQFASKLISPIGFTEEKAKRYNEIVGRERKVIEVGNTSLQSQAGTSTDADVGSVSEEIGNIPEGEDDAIGGAWMSDEELMALMGSQGPPLSEQMTDVDAEEAFNSDEIESTDQMLLDMMKANEENKTEDEISNSVTKSSAMSSKSSPIQVFSDGSDIKGTGNIGYGATFEYNNKFYDFSGTNEDPDVQALQKMFPAEKFSNPTMEMFALLKVVQAFTNTKEHIVINQDYKGAVNYNGLWQRAEGSIQRDPKPWTAKVGYIKYIVDEIVKSIVQIEANGGSVKINWVKGHSGNKMNDRADQMAKSREIFNNFNSALVENGAIIIKPGGRPGLDLSDENNC